MEHFWQKIQGWFTFPEFYTEIVKRFPAGSDFVEVGAWKGQSAAFMAVEIINSGKFIRFHVVDTWKGSGEHQLPTSTHYEPLLKVKNGLFNLFKENLSPVWTRIHPMRGSSGRAAVSFKNQSLEFVFLDGSHEKEDVKADIKAWLPKIKTGGILAGHDINNWQVEEAVQELLPNYKKFAGDVWYIEVNEIVK